MANLDIGSLKLQFNNEVLKVKKYILQAKTQIIHKLTRTVQKLKTRKGTDEELKKFKTKAESIVSEIMFIKKIQHNDLARFAIKHFNDLPKVMNTPVVTEEKAMAKLLSHKCLNSKFQDIVNQFSIVPADTLLQVNPKKLRKKENKKKAKLQQQTQLNQTHDDSAEGHEELLREKLNSISGDSEYEEVNETVKPKLHNLLQCEDSDESDGAKSEEDEESNEQSDSSNDKSIHRTKEDSNAKLSYVSESEDLFSQSSGDDELKDPLTKVVPKQSIGKGSKNDLRNSKDIPERKSEKLSKFEKQNTDINFKPVAKPRKMLVDLDDNEVKSLNTEKTVDSFFVTDSGDNYLTQSLPRKPDPKPAYPENSTVNRKMRRAALFGNEMKPKRVTKANRNERFNKFQNYDEDRQETGNKRKQFQERPMKEDLDKKLLTDEKLHPSWEAKKKKSALVAFEGKKVVFDE